MTNGLMNAKIATQSVVLKVAGIALFLGGLAGGDALEDSILAAEGRQRFAATIYARPV